MAARQGAAVRSAKPKPKPNSTNTFKGSGIRSKPLRYKANGKKSAAATNTSGDMANQIRAKANKLLGRS